MKKTMKKTAAALCIAATLVSVAAPAMAVSPAEYMSTAALEYCDGSAGGKPDQPNRNRHDCPPPGNCGCRECL